MTPKYGYCKSEKAFLNWLERALRKAWNKHPVKLEMKRLARFRQRNPKTGRMAFFIKCQHCNVPMREDAIECNHKVTVGTGEQRLTIDNFGEWTTRLMLVTADELELLCAACHGVVTYSERSGLSHADSVIEKRVIKFSKLPAAQQKEKIREVTGLAPAKTKALRKAQVRDHLKKLK